MAKTEGFERYPDLTPIDGSAWFPVCRQIWKLTVRS